MTQQTVASKLGSVRLIIMHQTEKLQTCMYLEKT
jgi:hypothetical protein